MIDKVVVLVTPYTDLSEKEHTHQSNAHSNDGTVSVSNKTTVVFLNSLKSWSVQSVERELQDLSTEKQWLDKSEREEHKTL